MRTCLLLLLAFAVSVCGSDETRLFRNDLDLRPFRTGRKLQQAVAKTKDMLPRRNLAGDTVGSRFCGMHAEANSACAWQDYAEAMGFYAAPGVLLAALSLVGLPVFLILRCCCNCFGGRTRSKGCFFGGNKGECCACCGGKRSDWKGYTRRSIWLLRIGLVVLLVGTGASLVWGFIGNSSFDAGIGQFIDTIFGTATKIITQGDELGKKLVSLPYTKDAGAAVNDAVRSGQEVLDQATAIRGQVEQYNGYRSNGVLAAMIVPPSLLLLAVLSSLCNWKYVVFLLGCLCFVASFVVWLLFGLHFPLGVVVSDVCLEIDTFLKQPLAMPALSFGGGNATAANGTGSASSAAGSPSLDQILNCNGGDAFKPIKGLAEDALNQAFGFACQAIEAVCNDSFVDCRNSNCSRSNIELYKQEVLTDYSDGCLVGAVLTCNVSRASCAGSYVPCPVGNITLEQCATSCVNDNLRNQSFIFVDNLNLLLTYEDILENDIFPLLQCDFIKTAFDNLKDAFCVKISSGIDEIATVSGFLACALVPATFFMIVGFKRFRRDNPDPSKIAADEEGGYGDPSMAAEKQCGRAGRDDDVDDFYDDIELQSPRPISPSSPFTKDQAATKIQTTYRGYAARKDYRKMRGLYD